MKTVDGRVLYPSRSEALASGGKYYEMTKPCPSGHLSFRMVSNFGCYECLLENNRSYQQKNREVMLPKKRLWAKQNPDMNRAQSVRWYHQNKEKALELNYESKKRNWETVVRNGRIQAAKRKAALLRRTPVWADTEAIKLVYQNCPPGLEVDHIVPLLGKTVSGLHVHNNLQYLTKSENSSKGAKYEDLG